MDLAEQAGAVTLPGTTGKFQPSLCRLLVRIDGLYEDGGNVRLHPDDNIKALQSSLDTFGQAKPVVFRKDSDGQQIVIAGNGTLRAAKALGWTHLAALEFSGDRKFASAYAIADNRIPELASWDQEKLEAQVLELSKEWEASGLEWTADTSGLVREQTEIPKEKKERDRDRPPAERVSDAPPESATSEEITITGCLDCGSQDTVCAACTTEQLVMPLLSLREAIKLANADVLASEAHVTSAQAKAVLEAIGRLCPQ